MTARYVASKHLWDALESDSAKLPIVASCFCFFGLPAFGFALGRLLPKVTMLLARAELIQGHHLMWLRVILEDHEKGRDKHFWPTPVIVPEQPERGSPRSSPGDTRHSNGSCHEVVAPLEPELDTILVDYTAKSRLSSGARAYGEDAFDTVVQPGVVT